MMNKNDLWVFVASMIFGTIGFVAFSYGWKNRVWRPMLIGFALMGYTYLLSNVIAVYAVGCALTAALYYWRE
ncbi:MAG: hypothetical protein HQL17_02300 [Candidatus Omnitrophica bacterium]|nr:hypothetical protein [Candidatus Omnitrophota bacterium]